MVPKYEASGNAKALALIKKMSPAAWRHIHLNGHYTFRSDGQIIDLDAIVAGLEVGWRNFLGFGLTPPKRENVACHAAFQVCTSTERVSGLVHTLRFAATSPVSPTRPARRVAPEIPTETRPLAPLHR